jgi:hypothetical protein
VSDFIAERIWPEAHIERSIFGTDDPSAIWTQVLEACPDAVECFAFEVSVGARFGLRLRDGSRIALKVHVGREGTHYLQAIQRVQKHLWEQGFPCPKPLGFRERVTMEEWREDGVYRDAHEPEVRCVIAGQPRIEPFAPEERAAARAPRRSTRAPTPRGARTRSGETRPT